MTGEDILANEINLIGGGGSVEFWYGGAAKQTEPHAHESETCVTVTWMRLCEKLYRMTKDEKWLAAFRKTFFNVYLGAISPDARVFIAYPSLNGRRTPGRSQCGMKTNCCNQNGMRGFVSALDLGVIAGDTPDSVHAVRDPHGLWKTVETHGHVAFLCGELVMTCVGDAATQPIELEGFSPEKNAAMFVPFAAAREGLYRTWLEVLRHPWEAAEPKSAPSRHLRFDNLFQDHAVLQQGVPIPVWGYGAEPSDHLEATLNGVTTWTVANPSGEFHFRFPAAKAGGPYVLEVKEQKEGGKKIAIADVYIGEVWLCSGQSNMEFPMKRAKPGFGSQNRPLVRMYTVAHSVGEGKVRESIGTWERALVGQTDRFSAVACFFGMALQQELGCAVGLINASWGGTRIEPWMSRRALAATETGRVELQEYYDGLGDARLWNDPDELNAPYWPLDAGPGEHVAWAAKDLDETDWIAAKIPGYFYDHYKREFNGAVWYRKSVEIPADWAGQDLVLRLPGVDKMDISYFNGREVGRTGKRYDTKWYATQRDYPIAGAQVKPGKAVVAVRVWSQAYAGGIDGDVAKLCLARKDGQGSIPLAGEWRSKIEKDIGKTMAGPQLLIPGASNMPSGLFEGMIRPLIPYAIKGVVWYQGESNGSYLKRCDKYAELSKAMITDWRAEWMQGDFPFIFTELAAYMPPRPFKVREPWAEIRSAMRQVSLELPNVGLASALDLALKSDFEEIHPPDKLTVGNRLARWALATQYGRIGLVPTGPRFVRAETVNGKLRCYFTDVAKGLVAKDSPDGSVKWVYVAGPDRNFVPAQAVVDGDTLLVWSPDVTRPMHVLYAWALNPDGANLYNSEGLPAATFSW